MLSGHLRRVALLSALFALALAASVSSAGALEPISASKITSPADLTPLFYDRTVDNPETVLFTIEGTTTGAGSTEVDVRCYFGPTSFLLAANVPVSANTFVLPVNIKMLEDRACELRAVPVGDTQAFPPGTPSPFEGPRLTISYFEISPEAASTTPTGYELGVSSFSSQLGIESVGGCGLDYSLLLSPGTLQSSDELFNCNAVLFRHNETSSLTEQPTRSELLIDGANAYSPETAYEVESVDLKAPVSGLPKVTATKSLDAAAGAASVQEIDPIVKCAPAATYPPTTATCTSFVSTGVQLERAWRVTNNDQLASVSDIWRSTDAATHTVDALYDQSLVNGSTGGGAYQFPGTPGFAPVTTGQSVSVPTGPGTILYKENASTPEGGDGMHPQGAIVYDVPPSAPLHFYQGTANPPSNGFNMPYQRTIPPSGTVAIRMAFVQAFSLTEVGGLIQAANAAFHPSVRISSPVNGAAVSSSSLAVSGLASDTGRLRSVEVDGKAVPVAADGTWSATVTLTHGANTVSVVAHDEADLSSTATASVTYTPPAPHASLVGKARAARGNVSFTLDCKGVSSSACVVDATLTTIVRLRAGKPEGVSAAARRRHARAEAVGSAKVLIPGGKKIQVTVKLNSTGKKLLSRFGRLPVHLLATSISGGVRSTIVSQSLTIKPTRHKR